MLTFVFKPIVLPTGFENNLLVMSVLWFPHVRPLNPCIALNYIHAHFSSLAVCI